MTFSLTPGKLGFKLGEVLVGLQAGTTDTPETISSTQNKLHTLGYAWNPDSLAYEVLQTSTTGLSVDVANPATDPVNTSVVFADSVGVDAFNRLRVSVANTVFDSQQEYGLQTSTTWDASANGTFATASTNGSVTNGSNAVGPTNADTRLTPITVSSTDTHYSILQSRQYARNEEGNHQGNVASGRAI